MLILKQNAANTVPTPPVGKGTIFLNPQDDLSVKTADGNVTTFPTAGGSNTQVYFNDDGSFGATANFTFNKSTNVLTITGNVAATRVLTDNLLYANGTAWDLSDPGGANTQIQFNDDESFGGSAAFVFNKSSNLVTVSANLNSNNLNATTHITSGNVWANSGIIGAQTLKGEGGNISNIQGGNVSGTVSSATTAGTVTTAAQPNITSVGTLSSLSVSGNASAGNISTGGTVTANGNITANYFIGNGSQLTGLSLSSISNGNSNVSIEASSGNISLSAGPGTSANGNIIFSTSGSNVLTITEYSEVLLPDTALFVLGDSTSTNAAALIQVSGNDPRMILSNYASGNASSVYYPDRLSLSTDDYYVSIGQNENFYISNAATGASGTLEPGEISVFESGSGGGFFANAVSMNYVDANGNGFTANANGGYHTKLLQAPQLISNVATGTAPLTVTSTTRVANLNVAQANVADFISVAAGTGNNFLIFANAATGNITELTSTGLTANLSNNSITATTFVGALSGAATTAGTVTTAAQPNITSVGTLTSVAVTGNATAGNVYANSGTIGASLLTGTLTTAAQPNITSVGTLGNLSVTANVIAGNVYANSGTIGAQTFKGEGGNISNIQGANVSGAVATATTAGTVTTAAQPNITSVGTLTSLSVTGNISAGNVSATTFTGALSGAATTAGTVTTAAQPNITSVGTLGNLSVTANVAAGNLTTTGVLTVSGTGVSSIAGNLDMTSNTIINLATPTNPTDAATKQYVDDVAQGLNIHDSCQAATPDTLANVTGGTITYNNGSSGVGATLVTTGTFNLIDGVNVQTAGTRILVKNEANAVFNGIYTYTNTTAITRAADFNSVPEVEAGDFTFVTGGTLYDNTGWVQVDSPTGIGTAGNTITFTQFSGAGTYTAGTGLTLNGSTFSISNTAVTSASYGNGDRVATFTVNSQGQLTAAANTVIAANAANLTGTTLASGITTSSLTTVGTLGSLAVTGNATAGNVYANSGTIGASLLTGTLTTAAQPNITSVGTLTSAAITGNATAGNVYANSGTIGASLLTGTLTTAAQPNVTSVGTLTSLAVTGNASAGNLNTAGAVVASTLTSNVATGTAPLTVTSTTRVSNLNVAYANVADNINVAAGTGNNFLIFANAATGNVAELTSTGLTANLSNNSITATTFVGALSGAATSATTAGTVTTAAQPNITSVSTSFTGLTFVANAQISMSGAGSQIDGVNLVSANSFSGNGSSITALNATNISSGTLAQARLANASVTLGSTALTLGSTVTTVAGLSSVTSTTFVGALSGAATTAGTVTTAAQPNITSVGTLTGLTLANASVISVGSNTNVGTFTGNFSLSAGSRLTATYADLAEKYAADATYESGTVLLFGGEHEVTLSTESDSTKVAGVVTTNPAYSMNSALEAEHVAEIALQGRVPVKVTGTIAKGDLMVSASNGHATANNEARAGTIIGKALENFAGETGVIEVAVGRF